MKWMLVRAMERAQRQALNKPIGQLETGGLENER